MKVFISHPFKDEILATTLKQILEEKGINAYMAQRVKEYEVKITEKVVTEINNSDYVVAIITKNTRASASVNQELGYAQGRNVPRIAMIEKKGSKIGVLLHGMDSENFTREDFIQSCNEVRNYLLKQKHLPKRNTENLSEDFLKERHLIQSNLEEFGHSSNSAHLENPLSMLMPTKKPLVLFTACPKILLKDIPVSSKEFASWLETKRQIKSNNIQINFLRGSKKIDLTSITYYSPNPKDYSNYLELQNNGFIEQGFTHPFIYPTQRTVSSTPLLHLCWITGAFLGFLTFSKMYYSYLHYSDEIDVILSIKHSNELMLMGFGGKTENGKWADPVDNVWWNSEEPRTKNEFISLRKEFSVSSITDREIANLAHEFSTKISNAYGLEDAMCYNLDGTLNSELFSYFNMHT